MHVDHLLWLIPTLPLLGFLINGLFGAQFSRVTIGTIAVVGPLISFVLSVLALIQAYEVVDSLAALAGDAHGGHGATSGGGGHHPYPHQLVWTWIATGELVVNMGLQVDPLTGVMLMNVTGIGTAIHLFSYGYMHEDPSFSRFMAYLNLFLCAMLVLVMADNLVLLFVGWEGVGLCSYLLIGFWYKELENVDAGRKAFVVNRVGDFAFLIGLFTLFGVTGAVDFAGLEDSIEHLTLGAPLAGGPMDGWTAKAALTLAALCLFGGATGKSAQLPLYVWLPDAMAGPTPVSALIHAATMVTAGVYLIGRMDFLFVLLPEVTQVVAFVAAATAVLSALIAVAQYDIKKILAYSTVSQLGFMFCGMASTFWTTGLFHVVTHAFFKALLFLGAGAVIHAMHGEQDIRKMGGLWRDLRVVTILFLVGSLALAGVPPFAGFFSKDEIMGSVFLLASQQGGLWWPVFAMLLFTAIVTAFYTTRLVMIAFFGEPVDSHRHLHMPHWTMTSVLAGLAVLAAFGGIIEWAFAPIEEFTHPTWEPAPVLALAGHEAEHSAHIFAMLLSTAAATLGVIGGFLLYGPQRQAFATFVEGPLAPLRSLAENKFYVDELYNTIIVQPIGVLARNLWTWVDRWIIDGMLVEGPGKVVLGLGTAVRATQVGVVSVATTATLVGAIAVLMWMVLHG
jgi:NADH-quinone oxidoreductase subunit L